MKNTIVRPATAGSAHIAAAWLFLVAAIVAGIVGVYRVMSPPPGAGIPADTAVNSAILAQHGAGCLCLGVLLGVIGALLALLGIHRQMTAMALSLGPTYQGSHGSGDDDT